MHLKLKICVCNNITNLFFLWSSKKELPHYTLILIYCMCFLYSHSITVRIGKLISIHCGHPGLPSSFASFPTGALIAQHSVQDQTLRLVMSLVPVQNCSSVIPKLSWSVCFWRFEIFCRMFFALGLSDVSSSVDSTYTLLAGMSQNCGLLFSSVHVMHAFNLS